MPIQYVKSGVVALWVAMLSFVAYLSGPASATGWLVLGTLAIAAPLVMLHYWQLPAPTTSESIREVMQAQWVRRGRR